MTTDTIQQIQIGSKIYFEREKRPYTVRAMDERYIIATKPFNARKTCLYSTLFIPNQNLPTHEKTIPSTRPKAQRNHY